jgi:hypothetical protein
MAPQFSDWHIRRTLGTFLELLVLVKLNIGSPTSTSYSDRLASILSAVKHFDKCADRDFRNQYFCTIAVDSLAAVYRQYRNSILDEEDYEKELESILRRHLFLTTKRERGLSILKISREQIRDDRGPVDAAKIRVGKVVGMSKRKIEYWRTKAKKEHAIWPILTTVEGRFTALALTMEALDFSNTDLARVKKVLLQ